MNLFVAGFFCRILTVVKCVHLVAKTDGIDFGVKIPETSLIKTCLVKELITPGFCVDTSNSHI